MKPVRVTGPRYQMRTWLLWLGFIGEAFEKEHLDDAAFRGGQKERRQAIWQGRVA